MLGPRADRIDWNTHHMLLALVTAQRSPDPNTQVGGCLVNSRNQVLGLGYNGFPKGVEANSLPWDRENSDPCNTKYPYVVHAEINTILNAKEPTENSILYITLFPCSDCMKTLIQKGIKKIIYLEDKYPCFWQTIAAKKMADLANIEHSIYVPSTHITIAL